MLRILKKAEAVIEIQDALRAFGYDDHSRTRAAKIYDHISGSGVYPVTMKTIYFYFYGC